MIVNKCPVCGSTELVPSFKAKDYYATGEEFEIWNCNSCGFLFTQNFPDENEIGRYYDTSDYISHSNTKKGIVNKIYHLVRSQMILKKAKLTINNAKRTNGTVLDYGCGIGYFLDEMKKNGFSVQGIEINDDARKFAASNFGLETFPPSKINDFTDASFDIITAWHSLEHVDGTYKMLKQINRILSENGTFVVALPNVKSADAEFYKEFWAAYDVPRHLWHFSPATFKMLARNTGFKVEKMYPMPFDAFYISMLSEKYKNHSFSFIRGAWVGLKCYFKSRKQIDKSSSIIYILKKRT